MNAHLGPLQGVFWMQGGWRYWIMGLDHHFFSMIKHLNLWICKCGFIAGHKMWTLGPKSPLSVCVPPSHFSERRAFKPLLKSPNLTSPQTGGLKGEHRMTPAPPPSTEQENPPQTQRWDNEHWLGGAAPGRNYPAIFCFFYRHQKARRQPDRHLLKCKWGLKGIAALRLFGAFTQKQ